MNKTDCLQSDELRFKSSMLPRSDGLILLLKNREIRQRLLSHASIADTLVAEAVKRSGLTCGEIEERLAAFIDEEHDPTGELVSQQAVALHIHSCPWCYDIYALAHEVLAAQRAGLLPHWPQ